MVFLGGYDISHPVASIMLETIDILSIMLEMHYENHIMRHEKWLQKLHESAMELGDIADEKALADYFAQEQNN